MQTYFINICYFQFNSNIECNQLTMIIQSNLVPNERKPISLQRSTHKCIFITIQPSFFAVAPTKMFVCIVFLFTIKHVFHIVFQCLVLKKQKLSNRQSRVATPSLFLNTIHSECTFSLLRHISI